MRCPFCGNNETQVKDSRISDDGESIKRRRYCSACDSRFTTFERVQLKEVMVIKKNGEKKIFDMEKLRKSVEMAVRKRPVTPLQVDRLVSHIIRELEIENESEVPSSKIGEMVMEALKNLDKVAFVRFASVYKNFEKADDFQKFIKKIL
ncbi:MAG: transcriptional regulator NrdR [Alphaproteobacteria bacterium]